MRRLAPGSASLLVAVAAFLSLPAAAAATGFTWLEGRFEVPFVCYSPVDIGFSIWEDGGQLRGRTAARFDGRRIVSILSDRFARIQDLTYDGRDLVVTFQARGYGAKGEFGNVTALEVDIPGCGRFRITEITSCAKTIVLNSPREAHPAGRVTYTAGDGACLRGGSVSVDGTSWGRLKAAYRE